jgi:hypothetical protein
MAHCHITKYLQSCRATCTKESFLNSTHFIGVHAMNRSTQARLAQIAAGQTQRAAQVQRLILRAPAYLSRRYR